MQTLEGPLAFVPSPLPPDLRLTWEIVQALSRADRALAELAGLARNLQNPRLLLRSFTAREAVLSSKIEGTQASLSDLFQFEASGKHHASEETRTDDVREVANYVVAMEHGLRRELPLSLRLIRELHGVLLAGVGDVASMTPGEFRLSQNWIGSPGCTLATATYIPPPVGEMNSALDHFEKFLHARSGFPPLVSIALVHYQFEAIHPFLDGNGRIGRLLISLLTVLDGLLPGPFLYLSAYFEDNRPEYYQRLLDVSLRGAWAEWLVFFLAGVEREAADAAARATRLIELSQDYRRKFESSRASVRLLRLLDELFRRPVVTIPIAARTLRVTQRAAAMLVKKLVDAGILVEITGRTRNRFFLAKGILAIVDAPR